MRMKYVDLFGQLMTPPVFANFLLFPKNVLSKKQLNKPNNPQKKVPTRPIFRSPSQHGHQKVGETQGVVLLEAVFFAENVVQRPHIQFVDATEGTGGEIWEDFKFNGRK